jgi:AraC-like DNA-binding protein
LKATYRRLSTPIEQAFHIRKDVCDAFEDKWHFHDMCELVYIEQGSGYRLVGDSIDSFSEGEVVLLGSRLPHVWKSQHSRNVYEKEIKCAAYVVQFPINFLGESFFELSESRAIKNLLSKAKRGIVFNRSTGKYLAERIIMMSEQQGMNRLVIFLDILQYAAKTSKYQLLASPRFLDSKVGSDKKMNAIFDYILDNFRDDIQLGEVAKIAGMNKTSFCRYFKNKTNITFSRFLNELRIGYACKLITEDTISINEAAYISGFNSPSYFYYQFKKIKGITPKRYQSKNL